ncbi:CAM kinase, CDPK family, putative [Eimeria mitis]|uniref:CAM kinase, CDPK family, putative n=1 Tax=Eimeria mitis TaxID=44415 RepID=U6KCT4_9EIME|nr:CAM kinase, CDPK family, putative [Eimeria mitis]CDJ35764.1 CAM kinase, CDPK family, putative [Eimeria mitis]
MGAGISRAKNKSSRNQQGRLLPPPAAHSPSVASSKQAQAAPVSSSPERCVTLYHREGVEKEKEQAPSRLRTLRAPGGLGGGQHAGPSSRRARGNLPRPHTQSETQGAEAAEDAQSTNVIETPISPVKESRDAAVSPVKSDFSINRSNFILENAGKIQTLYDIEPTTLGSGTYGSVSRAIRRSTGMQRAVKTISKSQVKSIERFRREIDIMKSLVRHSHNNTLSSNTRSFGSSSSSVSSSNCSNYRNFNSNNSSNCNSNNSSSSRASCIMCK